MATAAATAASILAKVPWKEVVRYTPTLVDSSRRLFGLLRKPRDGDRTAKTGIEELQRKLRELESRATEQADLVVQIAEQTDAVARGIVELETRIVSLEQSDAHHRRNELILRIGVGLSILLSVGAVIVSAVI